MSSKQTRHQAKVQPRRAFFLLLCLPILASLTACNLMPFSKDPESSEKIQKLLKSATSAPKSRIMKIWLVKTINDELELVEIERPLTGKDPLASAVEQLLRGPDEEETEEGLGTEIPIGTILLGIEREDDKTVLNLSRRFSAGGGMTSFETRMEQLSRTVKDAAGNQKVYLDIEGERLTASASDGLEIKQPIN